MSMASMRFTITLKLPGIEMSSKSHPTELWSASLITSGRKELSEARRICNEWAVASMFRFVLIIAFLVALVISRYFIG